MAKSGRSVAKLGKWVTTPGRWVAQLGKWMDKSGRWVAKSGSWVAKSGRRVAKSGRWVAKLVALLLLRQLSGFEPRHFSKIQNRQHKQRSGQHSLARQKKYIVQKMSQLECPL
jgi:hypothetical protein